MIKLIKEFLKTGIEANKASLVANNLHIAVGYLHKELINKNIEIANHHCNLIIEEEIKQKECIDKNVKL